MDINLFEQLADLLNTKGLSEITYSSDNSSITLKKEFLSQSKPLKSESKCYEIKSLMVGNFYNRPSSDSEPFCKVGDYVNKGDTVCIIEAMKLMNEIKTEVSGRVQAILVNNGDSVDYGQVLIRIEDDK